MLSSLLHAIFQRLDQQQIEYIILRNYDTLPEKKVGGDIDFLLRRKDVFSFLTILWEQEVAITSIAQRIGSINLFLSLSSRSFVQIDLIYEIQYLGIPYLSIEEILAQRRPYKNFYVGSAKHEYFFHLLPFHFYTGHENEKYTQRQKELYEDKKQSIDNIHQTIFGSAQRRGKRYFLWKKRSQIFQLTRHYRMELYKYLRQPYSQTVVLLGPDGAGKSTILDQ
ncbi:MAG: hypothetical protein VX278_15920, partial [Myxococcota bacterium]|nr:hypothetical protein [Myxococcota bacterium]